MSAIHTATLTVASDAEDAEQAAGAFVEYLGAVRTIEVTVTNTSTGATESVEVQL